MPVIQLFRPLLDHLEQHCEKHADDCSLGSCVRSPELQGRRRVLTLVSDAEAGPRRVIRDERCRCCTFVLMLESIQRNVPVDRVRQWLDDPLFDLAGRTPRECLDQGDIEPVIDALWLLDQHELTCG